MKYPGVVDEFGTIAHLQLHDKSLARVGDGELKMAMGAGYTRQLGSEHLARELKGIIQSPHRNCIVGIPTMDPTGPKYQSWIRHEQRFLKVLSPAVQYYSAFVSRPDSAPRIATREYAQQVTLLWAGKRTVVLCEKNGSMFRAVKPHAGELFHVRCPSHQAYDVIEDLQEAILAHRPEVVILSCGPTATCLANRLAGLGVQAIDLGSAGAFITRMLA